MTRIGARGNLFFIFLLVGLNYDCIPNFSFLGFPEVVVGEATNNNKFNNMNSTLSLNLGGPIKIFNPFYQSFSLPSFFPLKTLDSSRANKFTIFGATNLLNICSASAC